MSEIYIEIFSGGKTISIVEEDRLVEYYEEKEDKLSKVGNIYRARVERVLKNMNAAFVNIGEGKNAFLGFEDIPSSYKENGSILIKSGDTILVQVIKDEIGSKGPKVTMNFSLAGKYIVLSPFKTGISTSKRLHDSDRKYLIELGKNIFPQEAGIIFRTNALGAKEEDILSEYNELFDNYQMILNQINYLPVPKLVYESPKFIYKILRDYFNSDKDRVIINNEDFYKKILESFGKTSKFSTNIQLDIDFNSKYNQIISRDLKQALQKKVKLSSGGYLLIEELETLTAIDVNTGSLITGKNYQDIVLKTNLEAAAEIAIQLRLRNIGGIIIVDFIDMESEKDLDRLKKFLISEFKKDRNNPLLVDITKLNLFEVVREREVPSLKNIIKI
ncbi:MAG: ribonuclease E/G [Tissierellales bacterium]|nr:ribonuclease E/G [Tissierellales bacterium]